MVWAYCIAGVVITRYHLGLGWTRRLLSFAWICVLWDIFAVLWNGNDKSRRQDCYLNYTYTVYNKRYR